MTERHWLFATMTAAIAAFGGVGCESDSFTPTGGGGSGAATTTSEGGSGGGGQGGGVTTTTSEGGGGQGGGVTTTTTGEGGSGGGPVCQPISDPCAQCAYGACEPQYCACYASADCAALVDCFQDCAPGDAACQQACMSAHEPSISTAFLLGECTATPCAEECPGVGQVTPCLSCLFTSCSDQMNACLADAECYEIVTCAVACPGGDFNCALGCTSGKSSAAVNKAFGVQGCMQQNCDSMCP